MTIITIAVILIAMYKPRPEDKEFMSKRNAILEYIKKNLGLNSSQVWIVLQPQ